jgi:hypothetical protein
MLVQYVIMDEKQLNFLDLSQKKRKLSLSKINTIVLLEVVSNGRTMG